MISSSQSPTFRLATGALSGWVAFTLALAAYTFVFPHDSHFAPEVGPFGAFVVFGVIYTYFYTLDFVLLAVPYFFLFRNRVCPHPFLRIVCGAALFALSVPIWSLAAGSFRSSDMVFCMTLAAIAGAGCFAVLKPLLNTSKTT